MTKRLFTAMALLLVPALLLAAAPDDERGWSFSQRLQGSSNSAGIVLKSNSTVAYKLNSHVQAYAGLPVYFVRESVAISTTGNPTFMNGIGNVYTGITMSVSKPVLNYTSDLVLTAPTGDQSKGFSTGQVTVDWTNTFSRTFSNVTPYASLGVANTISDTSFFVRPFSSKGLVGHFELGTVLNVAPQLSIGASGYGVRATGEQRIISKVVEEPAAQQSPTQSVIGSVTQGLGLGRQRQGVFEKRGNTLGPADIANDNGFSTWFTVRPSRTTDFQIGYSRSVSYQLSSLFFGVGFRVGQ